MSSSIFFKSEGHKERFLSAIQQIGKVYDGKLDPEYGAALHILTCDLSTWEKAEGYVSRRGILFEEMLKEVDFSTGYRSLINLAWNLFNEGVQVNVVNLTIVDGRNFKVALEAIKLRRESVRLDDLKQWPN